ncbi:MAG: bifunctional nuclease family protein [Bacteroidetes Order II. Incertae sedis bacterium]|nr:bifunctional nuclease family protein [Bacteroidetes Order II. bacterium]
MDLIQVDIIGLSTSPSSGGAYALVLGEMGGNRRRLPIIIGASEAQAIALELEKIDPPRPMTHDLLRDVFRSVRANVSEIVIDELREGTFYAKIRYEFEGEEQELDARPSDAVALAVRVDVPIYVEVKVLEEAGIPTDEEGESPSVPVRSSDSKPKEKPASPKSNIERIQAELQKAIEDEEYEKAARLRDELERLTGKSN